MFQLLLVFLVVEAAFAELALNEVSDAHLTEFMGLLSDMDVSANKVPSNLLGVQGGPPIFGGDAAGLREYFARLSYSTLIQAYDNHDAASGSHDDLTRAEEQEHEDFITAVMATDVGITLKAFLVDRVGIPGDKVFKLVHDLWFLRYSMRGRMLDTSGFENVFLGVINGTKVIGFHNWVRYRHAEQDGTLTEGSMLGFVAPGVMSLKFKFHGATSEKTSMFVGTSPEFDMAAFTVCALVRNNVNCNFELRGSNVVIRARRGMVVVSREQQMYLETAYPVV